MPARVTGYNELLTALRDLPRDVDKGVRGELRAIGETVRADATNLFGRYSEKTANGYRVRVRLRGVSVEQSLRKTTGKRPDWGAIQMRKALEPALEKNQEHVAERIEAVVVGAAARLGF